MYLPSKYQPTTRELAGRRWLVSCPGPVAPGARNAAIRNARDVPMGLPLSVRPSGLQSTGTLNVTDVMSGGTWANHEQPPRPAVFLYVGDEVSTPPIPRSILPP